MEEEWLNGKHLDDIERKEGARKIRKRGKGRKERRRKTTRIKERKETQ